MVTKNNLHNGDSVWFDKGCYDEAERKYYERLSLGHSTPSAAVAPASSVVHEIARAREQIQKSLKISGAGPSGDSAAVIAQMERRNDELANTVSDLKAIIQKLESRVAALELRVGGAASAPAQTTTTTTSSPAVKADDDDDVDLFGSDDEEETENAKKVREERLAAYAAKKSKKPALVAKSSVVLDVKPWDDETDMKEMEKQVRTIVMDGLVWGASKLVPLAYGIKKLTIMCTVEDDKVSVEELSEKIEAFEDFVQSVDIAAFNKI